MARMFTGVASRLRLLAAALALLAPATARASALELFSPETLSFSADVRLVAADGERSWADGDFGKLRSGGRSRPELGAVDLVWQPRFSWALSATVVGTLQGGDRPEGGISEAYLSYKLRAAGPLRFSSRAGLIWAPISLEHEGADWHVRDTITPSAINSWIGEEVRPLAVEAKLDGSLGEHEVAATAALIAANDTAGTLLTFRGWALHDRRTLAGRKQPLPELAEEIEYYQAPQTHPLLDVGRGFARRPGYYAKLAWSPPLPIRLELFRYDNRADPEAVNADLEWGWRTQFDHAAAILRLGGTTELRMQAMSGRTRMGPKEANGIWVDAHFRSAFALVTQRLGAFRLAGRIDGFRVRQDGGLVTSADDERGWAATAALSRDFSRHFSGIVELAHVHSLRHARERLGLGPRQRQTQLQAMLRTRW